MLTEILLGVSILIQLATAACALRLIPLSGKRTAWLLIATAITVMAARRIILLLSVLLNGRQPPGIIPESLAVIVWMLMLVGVLKIAEVFRTIRTAEAKKADSEGKWRVYFDKAPLGVFVADQTGRILEANPAGCERTGYAPAELQGMTVGDLLAEGSKELGADHFRQAAEEGEALDVCEIQRRDGTHYWSQIFAVRLSEDRLLAFSQDVTEQREMEQALREREERLSLAVETANLGYWRWTVDTNSVEWFGLHAKLFGIRDEDFGGTLDDVQAIVHPDDRQMGMDNITRAAQTGNPFDNTYRVIHPDGSIHWLNSFGRATLDGEGKPESLFGVTRDISDFKFAQEALESRLAQLTVLLESMQRGVLVVNPACEVTYANQDFCDLFHMQSSSEIVGLPCDKAAHKIGAAFAEPEHFVARVTDLIARGEPASSERLDTVDGRILERTYAPIQRDGHLYGHLWLYRDKTEQVRAELAIARAKEQWEKTFDAVPDLISILDKEYRVLRINRAFAERIGKPPAEIIGRPCYHCVHETAEPPSFCSHRKTMEDGDEHSSEIIESILNGEFLVTTTPLFDEHGELTGSVHVARDITERKQAERLNQAQRDLAMALAESESLEGALDLCVSAALSLSAMDAGGIYLADPTSGELRLAHAVGLSEPFIESARAFCAGSPQARLVEQGKPVYCAFDVTVPKTNETRSKEGLRATAILPLVYRGNTLGSLNVSSHERDEIADHERRALEVLARQISQGIAQQQAEEARREHEENLNTFFNSVSDFLFVVDTEGAIVRVNSMVLQRLGYPEESLIGQSVFRLHPPQMRERAAKIVAKMIEGKHTMCDIPLWTATGEEIPVETYVVEGTWNGQFALFGVSRDTSERLAAEEALRASEEKFRTIAESTSDGILVIEGERIVYASPAHCKWFGYSEAEELGRTRAEVLSLIHPEDRSHVLKTVEEATRAGNSTATYAYRAKRKDGTYVWREDRAEFRYSEEGRYERAYVVSRDISERVKAEEEHLALERQIQHSQKLESLGVLAGGIAHDFNNLLMVILGHVDLALDELPVASPARPDIQQIETAGKQAADLCKQMLAYSGKGKFVVERFDAHQLIQEMAHLLRTSISKKVSLNLQLEAKYAELSADVAQIRQVVMNLVINGSEAIGDEPGAITLATSNETIGSEASRRNAGSAELAAGTYLVIEVADTGCGMSQETMERLFDPFFTTKATGRGLGMSAVQGIIQGHKGSLELKSEEGTGTTLRVLLPATKASTPDIQDEQARPAPSTLAEGMSILVVDDEESVLELVQQMLQHLGFRTLGASNGGDAVNVYRKSQDKIDLVILDLTMPEMDGGQTFEKLKQIDADVQAIIASGYSESDIETRFAGSGIRGVIQKPYTLNTLKERLSRLLL